MKKTLALILALVVALSMLTVASAEEPKALKTGLAIMTNVTGSKDAETVSYDVTLAAVLVDDEGVIYDCKIDVVATNVAIDATGTITSDVNAAILSKYEKGDSYGMVAYGNAIAEWYQQADALAAYAIGKNAAELKSVSIDESGKALADTDLATTATMNLGAYVDAIEVAAANAQHLGAHEGDSVKLATESSLSDSKSATADAAGQAQLYLHAIALSENEGVITSAYINALQAKVAYDATGKITTDLTAHIKTKNELGPDYGMVAYGNAIAEWDAQAASFCTYITGKTAADVAGIAVNESEKATDADLTASVTIGIGEFKTLVEKAMK